MRGPHLVVMPLSVLSSWRVDLQRFCRVGAVSLHVHHGGDKAAREEAFEHWLKQTRKALYNGAGTGAWRGAGIGDVKNKSTSRGGGSSNDWKISLVLTTYDLALKDEHLLRRLRKGPCSWQYLVVRAPHPNSLVCCSSYFITMK